ncbi:TPA: hypothetical protein DF272_02405 [Candidatus Falkowbacteria bacterium]|nr:hypothetical protein [Candidatus Falkowbacteria bacterium]
MGSAYTSARVVGSIDISNRCRRDWSAFALFLEEMETNVPDLGYFWVFEGRYYSLSLMARIVSDLLTTAETLGTTVYGLFEAEALSLAEFYCVDRWFGCWCCLPGGPGHIYPADPPMAEQD